MTAPTPRPAPACAGPCPLSTTLTSCSRRGKQGGLRGPSEVAHVQGAGPGPRPGCLAPRLPLSSPPLRPRCRQTRSHVQRRPCPRPTPRAFPASSPRARPIVLSIPGLVLTPDRTALHPCPRAMRAWWSQPWLTGRVTWVALLCLLGSLRGLVGTGTPEDSGPRAGIAKPPRSSEPTAGHHP